MTENRNSNRKQKKESLEPKTGPTTDKFITDREGHYDMDGVSYRNGKIYVGSFEGRLTQSN
jgi:hypothetical protein